ncbi:unnamed protein product [Penicillium crustosum]
MALTLFSEDNDWDLSVGGSGSFEDPANPAATPMILHMAFKLHANSATWEFWKTAIPQYALTSPAGIMRGSNSGLWGFVMASTPTGLLAAVHIQDLIEAHIRALDPKIVDVSKYLLVEESTTVPKISRFVKKHYPDAGSVITEDAKGVLDRTNATKAETEPEINEMVPIRGQGAGCDGLAAWLSQECVGQELNNSV